MFHDTELGGDQPTDMRNLVRMLPDFKRLHGSHHGHLLGRTPRLNVFKQSSMNEELMSTERLREKERVRQNIQKQASLNEELMYRPGAAPPGTLDSLRYAFPLSTVSSPHDLASLLVHFKSIIRGEV